MSDDPRDVGSAICGDVCREQLLSLLAERGVEVTVTLAPPIIATGYEPLDMRCPHGHLWFIEPTSEQRAKWAAEGVA